MFGSCTMFAHCEQHFLRYCIYVSWCLPCSTPSTQFCQADADDLSVVKHVQRLIIIWFYAGNQADKQYVSHARRQPLATISSWGPDGFFLWARLWNGPDRKGIIDSGRCGTDRPGAMWFNAGDWKQIGSSSGPLANCDAFGLVEGPIPPNCWRQPKWQEQLRRKHIYVKHFRCIGCGSKFLC